MTIEVRRKWFSPKSTIGELWVDGSLFCYTLEDVVRCGPKVPGKTAIPYGTYKVIINQSNRFKREMPLLLNVPGFEGVRIHSGNKAEDTEGCILVGDRKAEDSILLSRPAFYRLFNKMKACTEPISLTVSNATV